MVSLLSGCHRSNELSIWKMLVKNSRFLMGAGADGEGASKSIGAGANMTAFIEEEGLSK